MGLLNFKSKGTKALSTKSATWTIVNGAWSMPQDDPKTYVDGYKTLPNLYGIISLITQKSSIVPPQFLKVKNQRAAQKYKAMMKSVNIKTDYKKILKVKQEAFEEVEGSWLEELLMKPNEDQGMEELNEAHDGYLLLTGNSYFKAESPGVGKNAQIPKELFVIPSPCVTPKATGLKINNFKVSYLDELIPAEEIGHSKYFNPINGAELPVNQLVGMSPLLSCRNLIKRYEMADIAQGAMFSNMGPSGILTGKKDSNLEEGQAKAIQDKFRQFHKGATKAGDIVVTPAELHWTQIGLSPVDLNILSGKQEMLSELCNVYKVDIGIVTGENSTDNNMDNARKRLLTDAVMPLCERRKQTLNRMAARVDPTIQIEYDYSIFDELQEDLKEKWEWLGKVWELSPNDRLEEAGFQRSKDPLMDKRYIPSSLIPLEDTNLEPEEIDEEELNDNNAQE